jgi:hypothetical protein
MMLDEGRDKDADAVDVEMMRPIGRRGFSEL